MYIKCTFSIIICGYIFKNIYIYAETLSGLSLFMVLHFALSLWSIIFPGSGILSMWNPTLEEGGGCWRFHSPLPRIQDMSAPDLVG